ncbi:hypothetical protein NMY22_g10645 [Coprinellus aureogranulatus]|nr:hypothetical protein NMY22_g10645 [Coprinellus aureogranulatus]
MNPRDCDAKLLSGEIGDATNLTALPISILPTEILISIFLILISDFEAAPQRSRLDHPTLSLSQVCSRWRELSLNMPLLWSFISIYLPAPPTSWYLTSHQGGTANIPTPTDDPDQHLNQNIATWFADVKRETHRTALYLSRSADHPLTLRIYAADMDTAYSFDPDLLNLMNAAFERILIPVCAESHRWLDIRLVLTTTLVDCPLRRLTSISADQVPALRNVSLDYEDDGFEGHTGFALNIKYGKLRLLQASSLKRLKMEHLWNNFQPTSVNWSGITELYIGVGEQSEAYRHAHGIRQGAPDYWIDS